MYRFQVRPPKGGPVELVADSDWNESAKVTYLGHEDDVSETKAYLSGRYTPFGVLITDPERIAPQNIHFALNYESEGWECKPLEGEVGFYSKNEQNASGKDRDIVLDSANPSSSWLKAIQEASTLEQLSKAFLSAITGKPDKKNVSLTTSTKKTTFGLKKTGKKTREKLNAAAAEIVNRVKDPARLTEAEREVLVQYTGRGGLDEGSQSEYYTPPAVAEGVWDMLAENGFSNGNILEPSAGSGVFSATKSPQAIMTAVELDPLSSGVNALLHPEENNINSAFEQVCKETQDNTFDSVVGNVPFGQGRGKEAAIDKENGYDKETYLERYFIHRSIDKVKPGGLVALIVPPRVVEAKESSWKDWRREISLKAEFLGAVKLPKETFGGVGSQGTSTVSDVVLFKKHPKDILDKAHDLPGAVLTNTKLVWDEFVSGLWFKQTGKRHMAGQLVKEKGRYGDETEVLKAAADQNPNRNTLLKNLRKKLATKFHSRIDWDALESAEPTPRTYAAGDRRYVGGQEYEFNGVTWEKVNVASEAQRNGIDAELYGVKSWDELNATLRSLRGPLALTYNQLAAIQAKWPNKLSESHKTALRFASQQPEEERTLAFKGVLVGQLVEDARLKYGRNQDCSTELSEARKEINALIHKYGHPRKHRALKHSGEGAQVFQAFAQAKTLDGEFTDFLKGELVTDSATGYDSKNIKSIVEYLFQKSDDQTVQPEAVAGLYDGQLDITSAADLAQFDDIYLSDNGFVMPESQFLQGNVYTKIANLTRALAKEEDPRIKAKLMKQIQKLKEARTFEKLESVKVSMASGWLDRQYVKDFLEDMGYPGLTYTNTDEEFDDAGNLTSTTTDEDTNRKGGKFGGLKNNSQSNLPKQILNYLNGDAVRGKDSEGSAEHRETLQELDEQFHEWLQQHPDSAQIEEHYNRVFHPELPREYSDKKLIIENVTEGVQLHGYQSQAVRRLSEEGRGILAFGTGLGKTFTALALAKYNEQMGRANRTCSVVPKSVLTNWYHEAKALYGDMSGTLFVGVSPVLDKDGNPVLEPVMVEGEHKRNKHTQALEYQTQMKIDSPDEIRTKLWTITQTTNIRRVVMADSVFARIPIRAETMDKYASEWVSKSLLSDSDAGSLADRNLGGDGKKQSWAKITKEQRLKQRYNDEGSNKTDSFPFYEDMGFDSVIVDEAHAYKNIYSVGRHASRIAYLSNGAVADKATDMAIKMSHLRDQNKGRGPVLLTATPLTNSPLEVFNALSLVTDLSEFEAMGIQNSDDFIRLFGRLENRQRENLLGELKDVEALVGFENLTALRSIFYRYTHQRTADQVFGEGENKVCKAPEAREKRHMVSMNVAQEEAYQGLRRDAQLATASPEDIQMMIATGQLPATYVQRPLFSVLRDMERVSTDPDMRYKKITFHFPLQHKAAVAKLVGKLPKTISGKRFDPVEGKETKTVIEKEYDLMESGDLLVLRIAQEFEASIEKAVKAKGSSLSLDMVSHPISPKYAKLIENVKHHVDTNGKQIIFTEELTQHHRIGRMLAHQIDGLSLDQIGYINGKDTNKDTLLQEEADRFNTGKTRVVICNKKAEVGVNLQKGTTAIHHLTLPYTPASIEQRNGRGVRQGNTADQVDVYFYLARSMGGQSMDERRLDIIQNKANWIGDVMGGDMASVENADASDDDASLYMDLLVDDPEERERRIKQEKAKKLAAAKAKAKKKALSQLGTMIAAQGLLDSMDESRQQQEKKINDQLLDAGEAIRQLNVVISGNTIPAVAVGIQKKRGKPGENAETTLQRWKQKHEQLTALHAGLDKVFEERKKSAEAKIKMARSTLKGLEKRGDIPFDKSLIDNPADTFVLPSGRIVSVGQHYEFDDFIIKIDTVNVKERTIGLSGVVGIMWQLDDALGLGKRGKPYRNAIPFPFFEKLPLTLSSHTEEEVSILKMRDDKYHYSDLTRLDKDLFLTHCGEEQIHKYNKYLYRDTSGQLAIDTWVAGKITMQSLVWPDKDDSTLKHDIAKMALNQMRELSTTGTRYLDSGLKGVLEAFFGRSPDEALKEYAENVTEQSVIESARAAYEELKADNAEAWENPEEAYHVFSDKGYGAIVNAPITVGDNVPEINAWRQDVWRQCQSEVLAAKERYEQLQKQAKIDEARTANALPSAESVARSFQRLAVVPEEQKNGTWKLRLPYRESHNAEGGLVAGTQEYYTNSYYDGDPSYDSKEEAVKAAEAAGLIPFVQIKTFPGRSSFADPTPAGADKASERSETNVEQEGASVAEDDSESAQEPNEGRSDAAGGISSKNLGRIALLNMEARIVKEPLSWTGRRGRRTYKNATQANTLFLQSSDESGGPLKTFFKGRGNANKERFGAKYGVDPAPDMPGSWWYMPTAAYLDELLEKLEAL